jgi:hypothetical protein
LKTGPICPVLEWLLAQTVLKIKIIINIFFIIKLSKLVVENVQSGFQMIKAFENWTYLSGFQMVWH